MNILFNKFFSLAALLGIVYFLSTGSIVLAAEETVRHQKELWEMTPDELWDSFTPEEINRACEYEYRQGRLHPESCVTDFDIVNALVHLNAQEAFRSDFYRRSYPVRVRDPLDLPTCRLLCEDTENFALGALVFYNQTTQAYFTECSSAITSYLDIANSAFLRKLDLKLFNIDLPKIAALFTGATLQERRAGFMLNGCWCGCNFKISARTPLYYLEHNFFLSQEDRKIIEDKPFFNQPSRSRSDDEDAQEFINDNLVSDKFGFGDTRINLLYHSVETPCSDLWLGAQMTLPSAHTLKQGILGRSCFPSEQPNFDFRSLFRAVICEDNTTKAKEMGISLGVKALNRLTAVVANTPLGNGNHVGLGPLIEHMYYLTPDARFFINGCVEYLFPATEKRFFVARVPEKAFDRDYKDPEKATENLDFLNEQFINTLFPVASPTRVYPGTLIKLSTAFFYDTDCWQGSLGYDFWWQAAERVIPLHAAPPGEYFAVDIAQRPKAWQNKLFGKIIKYQQGSCYDWHLGLRADVTVSTKGIGRDFTLAIDVGIDF
jgi:hypothetical protein